jgi:hypothetical protein
VYVVIGGIPWWYDADTVSLTIAESLHPDDDLHDIADIMYHIRLFVVFKCQYVLQIFFGNNDRYMLSRGTENGHPLWIFRKNNDKLTYLDDLVDQGFLFNPNPFKYGTLWDYTTPNTPTSVLSPDSLAYINTFGVELINRHFSGDLCLIVGSSIVVMFSLDNHRNITIKYIAMMNNMCDAGPDVEKAIGAVCDAVVEL